MAVLLVVSVSGLSCTGLFGPEDAPIRVENETDLFSYSVDAEILIIVKNIGKKRIGVENHRSVQQWNGQEWVEGLLIHAPKQGVIMEPTYRYLRPGESLTDTVPVGHMGVGLVGQYRIVRVIISEQNRNGVLSATNSFTIEE